MRTESIQLGGRRRQRTKARLELVESKRFSQIVVGPGVEPGDDVGRTVARGENQHRHAPSARADAAENRKPVFAREVEIEHDGFVLCRRQIGVAIATVREDVDDVTVLNEPAPKQLAQRVVVFDDEHAHYGAYSRR